MSKLAAILIRGRSDLKYDIITSLDTINLGKKHVCTIVDDTPGMRGKLKKLQNVITYGEVSDETLSLLKEKATSHSTKDNLFFLAPPKGGYERKGIKVAFGNGGALGDRGDKINDLIKRMV
ncbi:MAG: hypothetical protein ACOCZV_02530 [Nanoarchaeota archaeon]